MLTCQTCGHGPNLQPHQRCAATVLCVGCLKVMSFHGGGWYLVPGHDGIWSPWRCGECWQHPLDSDRLNT